MKARLRDHVMFGGSMTRDVELVSFDWATGRAFFPDGRWTSVHSILVCEPEAGATSEVRQLESAFIQIKREEIDGFARQANTCIACGKQFGKPAQLNGHKRHCKGAP